MSVSEALIKLKQKKRVAKASLTRSENFFKSIDPNDVDEDEIKIRIDKAEETWKALSEIQVEIDLLDNTISEIELDNELEEYENKFLHLKLIAEKALKGRGELAGSNENLEQAFQEASIVMQRSTRNYYNFVRLPKIELSTGTYELPHWYIRRLVCLL